MAITVTATQGGNAGNGMLLRVYALTGIAAVQAGAAGNQTGIAAHSVTLSTATAGSQVYGAVVNGTNVALTADAGTTLADNVADGVNSRVYGAFRTTAATVTPGPVTVGVVDSFPGGAAAVEIVPAGVITQDVSSPAAASTTGATAVTTAAFTPPGGSLLIALVAASGVAFTGVTTMTVADSGGLAWTQAASAASAGNYYAGVWTAPVPATTVTATATLIASAPTGTRKPGICGYVRLVNGGTAIYLGGSAGVTPSNGALVAAGASWPAPLFAGDQLWAVTASGSSSVSVLQTGV